MDTGKPPAFYFKRHKMEEKTRVWYNTVWPPTVLSSFSDPENLACFLPPRELEKDTNSNLLSVSVPFCFCATLLHLPQGFSPTAYLLHRISQPSERNTPVTSHCRYRDNLYCLSSSLHRNRDEQQRPWTSYHLPAQTCSLPKLYGSTLAASLVVTGRKSIILPERQLHTDNSLTLQYDKPGRQLYTSTIASHFNTIYLAGNHIPQHYWL